MTFPQGRAEFLLRSAVYALCMAPYVVVTACVFSTMVFNFILGEGVLTAYLFFVLIAFMGGLFFVHKLCWRMVGRGA